MSEPISFTDIRKGDLVREEYPAGASTYRALEYVAEHDRHTKDKYLRGPEVIDNSIGEVCWFLLDRPESEVEAPKKPTLGLVEVGYEDRLRLGFFGRMSSHPVEGIATYVRYLDGGWDDPSSLSSFTPLAAFPQHPVEQLRTAVAAGWACSASVVAFLDQQVEVDA